MTRKKCIKILMNAVAESRYREAADLFTRSREAAQQAHVNVSNRELLARLLSCAIRAGANYGEVELQARAFCWLVWLNNKEAGKHDRLMGGPRERITQ